MRQQDYKNFLLLQGANQHTCSLSFKPKKIRFLIRKVEVNLAKIIVYSAVLLIAKEITQHAIRYWN